VLAAALVALAGLVACERPRDVAVRVSIPGPDSVETPVTGVGLIALPYDRDSVLAALRAEKSGGITVLAESEKFVCLKLSGPAN